MLADLAHRCNDLLLRTQRIFGEGTGENGLMILGGIPSSEDIRLGGPLLESKGPP